MKSTRRILKRIRKDILIDLIIEEERELEALYKELNKLEYLTKCYRNRLSSIAKENSNK